MAFHRGCYYIWGGQETVVFHRIKDHDGLGLPLSDCQSVPFEALQVFIAELQRRGELREWVRLGRKLQKADDDRDRERWPVLFEDDDLRFKFFWFKRRTKVLFRSWFGRLNKAA